MSRLTTLCTALALLALVGAAAAQPPVDYTLLCTEHVEELEDAVPIGVATVVDGQLHVWLSAGWACEDTVVAVALRDDTDVIEVTVDTEHGVVTLTFGDEEAALSSEATALPQQAIDGMTNAHARRTAAFEQRGRGAETAAAAREAAGGAERPQVDLDQIDDLDDEDEDVDLDEQPARPNLPEPAGSGRR